MSALYVVPSSGVRRCRKFGGRFFCTECVGQENDFELIPAVKMKTRHPVEDHLVMNFRRSVIIAELLRPWSHKKLKKWFFLCLLEKRPLKGKCSKFCSERIPRHTDRRVVFKFREIWPTRNRRALLTWQKTNYASICNSRYCADRAQNLPEPATLNVLRVVQISSKLVHFRRSYIRTRKRVNARWKVDPVFDWSLVASRIMISWTKISLFGAPGSPKLPAPFFIELKYCPCNDLR